MPAKILIADDEVHSREGLKKALEDESRRVDTAADGDEAWNLLNKNSYDVLITDIRMPGKDGMTLLKDAKELDSSLGVIIMTAYGTIEMAVDAMKHGAYNYLTKPVNIDEMEVLADQLLEYRRTQMELEYHREREQQASKGFEGVVGQSKVMQRLMKQIEQIAPSKANVLITGETGTGKELVARAIHNLSPRKNRIFIPIHCAALTENLLESELFGHERGAFTGAVKQRKGRFELADQGTVFLDEISEISQSIQVKLLRVLQEREFERVGGTETIKVDIRILAATNMDLQEMVKNGDFREDLYYRLKVVNIHIPPLRDRLEDIPELTQTFVEQFAKENGRGDLTVSPEIYEIFKKHHWPGNVRELQGVVESMVILTQENRLTKENIPYEIREKAGETVSSSTQEPTIEPGETTLADLEKKVILETLKKFKGNRTKTAEALGIGRRTLIRKLHEYGVGKETDEDEES